MQALLLVGLDEQKRHRGDHGGESEQEQFGIATIGQRGHHGHGRLRLCRHDTSRQLVPGSGGGGGSAVTVGDCGGVDGAGEDGSGGAGESASAGGGDSGATVRGVSGAGVSSPGAGVAPGGGASPGGILGTPGEFVGAGECGTELVRAGVGGAQTGSTELWASSSIWAIASSKVPDGRPAITCARSEGRMSLTPSMRQSRLSREPSVPMSDNSLRAFRQPDRKGSCSAMPRRNPEHPA